MVGLQPLDPDLTALANASSTNAIYYRSAANTWNTVTMGANLTFAGGTLSSAGAGGTNIVTGANAPFTIPGGTLNISLDPATLLVDGSNRLALGPDLTALEAASGTNVIYYRSAANTWATVTIGTGLSFAAGTLTATASGGNVSNSGTPTAGQLAVWVDPLHIGGIAATTYQPLDADLTSLAAAAATGIYQRSAPDTWTPVTIGTGLSLAGGSLTNTLNLAPYALLASPSFSGIPQAPTPGISDNSNIIATTAFVKSQGYLTATSAARTGDAKMTFQPTPEPGWVIANDLSIGDATSGATNRNNADTSALFALLYDNVLDSGAPIQTSAGAATTRAVQGTAATAFAAHCRLVLPRTLGRALGIAGGGAGLTSRALGGWDGTETHAITLAESPAHSHTITTNGHTHTISTGGHSHSISTGGHSHSISTGGHNHTISVAGAVAGTPYIALSDAVPNVVDSGSANYYRITGVGTLDAVGDLGAAQVELVI
jgi:hypothetical protein